MSASSSSLRKERLAFSPAPDFKGPAAYGATCRSLGSMSEPETRARALESAGLGGRPALSLRQVHGTIIHRATGPSASLSAPEGDGWVTDAAGVVLCVFVADCLPLFVWEKTGKAGGVFHAGWRGLEQGMARKAVESFDLHFGIKARELEAVIGPRIGACCFRVGPETAARFRPAVVLDRAGGPYVDLAAEALLQFNEAGVESAVDLKACTSCEPEAYFSYRRDKGDGRMMAFLSLNR